MGELTGICGSVGSGKSSLIHAILGEMICTKGDLDTRTKNIAYVSQSPWILSGSFKDNILFGKPFREEWFKEVVKACALDKDFAQLPDGEKTMIEERGGNLSGGQRSRISLARAVYANADVYLLDDPLSAVDTQVGSYLFKYCIKGVLRKKAVLLSTHLLEFVQKCEQVILVENGKLTSINKLSSSKSLNQSKFGLHLSQYYSDEKITSMRNLTGIKLEANELTDSQELRLSLAKRKTIKKVDALEEMIKNSTNQAQLEQLVHGSVPVRSYIKYFKAGATNIRVVFVFLLIVIGQISAIMTEWWLSKWTSKNTHQEYYFQIFIGLGLFTLLASMIRSVSFFMIAIKSSNELFKKMVSSVFGSHISFFNSNPQGRIMK